MMPATILALLALAAPAAALHPQGRGRLAESSTGWQPGHGEITRLPGLAEPLRSKHYGGYITVDEERGRHLYYWLAMSEDDPQGDPVVLWLNGGPGCSSFDGFMFELGPFNYAFTDAAATALNVTHNPYTWNKAATVIFLDSPAGVGLSYSETPRDYNTNDTQTAADTEAFLRGFFRRYPHLKGLDFYIAGESYAGIYVPNAVHAVVEGNRKGHKPHINIQGYLVGNGCTDAEYDGNALPPFAAGKSLISQAMYQKASEACGGAYWNAPDGGECAGRLQDVREELTSLNVYNVLEECHHGPKLPPSALAARAAAGASRGAGPRAPSGTGIAAQRAALAAQRAARYGAAMRTHGAWPVTGAVAKGRVLNWAQIMSGLGHNPPCTDASEGDLWLNDPAVRAAIHAAPVAAAGAPWTICSDRIMYTHDAGSMLWIHREMTQKRGLRALIYSGDHDMAVPHTGSEAWTHGLNLEKKASWRPWFVAEPAGGYRQVAGYVVEYEGLTFATVKGAGHMVPQSKPAEALTMFQRFLNAESL